MRYMYFISIYISEIQKAMNSIGIQNTGNNKFPGNLFYRVGMVVGYRVGMT